MKAKVKDIPVRYLGKKYLKGEIVEVAEKYFDENLFEKVAEKKQEKK